MVIKHNDGLSEKQICSSKLAPNYNAKITK